MRFDQYVHQLLNEAVNDISSLYAYRSTLLTKYLNFYCTRDNYWSTDLRIEQIIDSMSPRAYKKLYDFHKYAVMLNIIDEQPISSEIKHKVRVYIEREMHQLYEWCKIYLATTMDTRCGELVINVVGVDGFAKYIAHYSAIISQNYTDSDANIGSEYTPIPCYILLDGVRSLDDKIKAISLTLNVWHDTSSLMAKDWGLSGSIEGPGDRVRGIENLPADHGLEVFSGAPFTIAQLDSLSNIPLRVIEKDLHKLIDNVDTLNY